MTNEQAATRTIDIGKHSYEFNLTLQANGWARLMLYRSGYLMTIHAFDMSQNCTDQIVDYLIGLSDGLRLAPGYKKLATCMRRSATNIVLDMWHEITEMKLACAG